MKKIINGLMIGLCVTACSDPATSTVSPNVGPSDTVNAQTTPENLNLKQQLQSITQDYFALRPEIASYFGVNDAQAGAGIMSTLTDYSPTGETLRRSRIAAILTALEKFDTAPLSASEQVSLAAITSEMRGVRLPAQSVDYGTILGEYGIWFLPYSVSHLSGLHVEFPGIMEDKFAVTNAAEAQAYLSRLRQYPAAMAGLIDKMNHDVALGVIPPDFVIDKTIRNLQLQLNTPAAEHGLATSFQGKLAAASLADTASLNAAAIELIEQQYYPATRQLITALNAIRPKAQHTAGIGHLPKGEQLYQAQIQHLANSTKSAQEIHQLGLAQVQRITSEMDTLLREVGYTQGSVGERMQILLNDPKYIYPNTTEGKAQLMADIKSDLALVDAKLPQWFGHLPDQDVAVEAVPESRAASTSGAFYDAPSQDGSRQGTFWISLNDTASLPSYSLQTLTYHEANPGHHLQTIIGLSDELPLLSTIFYSNAAGEGWALYAERLASEMGIYQDDPIDDIGRLQSELHRAVRLVVDTGMHAKGWSREQAIDYAVATEGIHISEATDEIERYAVWPGQALGYKLGELKILELRERAQKTLGSQFDIKIFHDRLLENGALPLDLMEQKIDQWLASVK